MAIANITVGTSSTALTTSGGTDVTLSGDENAVIWISAGSPAEVGKGVKLDLFRPKHTFWGWRNEIIYGIVASGSAACAVHTG